MTIGTKKLTFEEYLAQLIPFDLICHEDTEIEVSGARAKTRLPDLMVLSEELAATLGDCRGTITREMPQNEDRNYRYKRSEYAAMGISEHWIINLQASEVTVLTLMSGLYEEREYAGSQTVHSQFQALDLTAEQVFKAKR